MLMQPHPHLQWNKVPQFKMLFDLQMQDNPVTEWKMQRACDGREDGVGQFALLYPRRLFFLNAISMPLLHAMERPICVQILCPW